MRGRKPAIPKTLQSASAMSCFVQGLITAIFRSALFCPKTALKQHAERQQKLVLQVLGNLVLPPSTTHCLKGALFGPEAALIQTQHQRAYLEMRLQSASMFFFVFDSASPLKLCVFTYCTCFDKFVLAVSCFRAFSLEPAFRKYSF